MKKGWPVDSFKRRLWKGGAPMVLHDGMAIYETRLRRSVGPIKPGEGRVDDKEGDLHDP